MLRSSATRLGSDPGPASAAETLRCAEFRCWPGSDPYNWSPLGRQVSTQQLGTRGEDGAIVSGLDGREAGDQAGGPGDSANQSSPGGIPPSFGAPSPKPPAPPALPAPGPSAAGPSAPGPPVPGPPAPEPAPAPDDPASVGWY